jgi:NADH-quinone oxidoreductase subunit J
VSVAFYLSGAVAIIATVLTITRLNAIHALLYLIVSLLAVSLVFYTLGATFMAALEVIIYAGAIMVLFVFVVMMLNLGSRAIEWERTILKPRTWLGPGILSLLLMAEFAWLLASAPVAGTAVAHFEPKEVGIALYGPYLLAVELASMLLLGALVAAYHLGFKEPGEREIR